MTVEHLKPLSQRNGTHPFVLRRTKPNQGQHQRAVKRPENFRLETNEYKICLKIISYHSFRREFNIAIVIDGRQIR